MAHHYFLPPAIATTIFAIFLFLSPPTTANSVVVDTEGNPLEVGSLYYVLTSGKGEVSRGGLTFDPKPAGRICPDSVVQRWFWVEKGDPVSLFPANRTQKQVLEGDEVNIAFPFGLFPLCGPDFGVWRMNFEYNIPYVALNGRMRSPGSEVSASRFKIEKSFANNGYKIVHCFEVPKPSNITMEGKLKEEICEQLDATRPGPGYFSYLSLVPNDIPLVFSGFVFQRVEAPPTTITTTTY